MSLLWSRHTRLIFVDDYNLTQMVHEPTRLENTLDLVFTTHPDLIENTYVVPCMSDHSAVICDINFKLAPPKIPPRTVFVYKKADMESLKQDLEHSFNTLLASDPAAKTVEENWADFKTTLISTSKKHIIPENHHWEKIITVAQHTYKTPYSSETATLQHSSTHQKRSRLA